MNIMKILKWLIKLDRILRWILVIILLIEILSGYCLIKPYFIERVTFNLINRYNAYFLHTLLDFPIFILASFHACLYIHQYYKIKYKEISYAIIILFIIINLILIIIEFG
ncbi:MAG: hypothetical protein QXP60_03155 [Nitrososphaerota archaeon]